MSGTVEILQSAEKRDAAGHMEHSFTIDIDESLTLDCSNMGMFPPPGANLVNGRLHIDRNKVRLGLTGRIHFMLYRMYQRV